jgi:hypothetical protein
MFDCIGVLMTSNLWHRKQQKENQYKAKRVQRQTEENNERSNVVNK